MMKLSELTQRVIDGDKITREEALWVASYPDVDELCAAADAICRNFKPRVVDSCSIVNARSGLCGEDCKWCAQSIRHHTGCETYDFVDAEKVVDAARRNEKEGIKRISLVTSGRTVSGRDLEVFCDMFRKISEATGISLCASMGLLGEAQMKKLCEAGVSRYHCNLETSAKVFPTLCTTHTREDKLKTIAAAKAAGLSVCSGGIIGMGETMADRVDFAFEIADAGVDSVPLNILNPIKGTPLQDTPPISEDEIVRTAAMMRFVLPDKAIRFAGGRMRLSGKSMLRMLRGGVNGVLMGDMLTTVSNTVADDRRLFAEAGLGF